MVSYKMQSKLLLSALLIAAITSSCSGSKGGDSAKQADVSSGTVAKAPSSEPVTISILNWNGMTDEEFERYFVKSVAKKYPNITLSLVKKNAGAAQDAIAAHLMAGNFPDLIFVSNKDINDFLLAKTVFGLDEFVISNKFDLKRFEPMAIASLQRKKEDGGLTAIPWAQNIGGLFYSKDVFDKFGTPYPKDLMTWEEMLELAKKLTRKEGDVQYLGVNLSSLSQFAQSLSVSYLGAKDKALVDTATWRRIMEFYKAAYAVPGGATKASLFGAKTVAMEPNWLGSAITSAIKDPNFPWDVAGLPNYKEFLGTGREIDAHSLAISASSKHKEQAFQVIQAVTSDEIQTEMSQYGRVPVLVDSKIVSGFGSQLPYLAGKNWAAMLKVTPAKLRENSTPYDSVVLGLINPLADRLRAGDADINTMLRETQEKADAALAAALGK
ncbi:ABC transporter substrate-binding protein [Paenibacillus ginsengarvi]|uniref:Extracellular solute-binding protein n=1 Tax=Paenibacillus ginsengarvi TaxID=400777 RepID=A0A3B0BVZ7_9BACL|nr:extracellular solute-binding protein [Paenibacillus ginsengarvi]RKN77160.1 extracellular solute-binding protein [Paenibacillus ginsengarvi]